MKTFQELVEDEYQYAIQKYPAPREFFELYGGLKSKEHALDTHIANRNYGELIKDVSREWFINKALTTITLVQFAVLARRLHEEHLAGNFTQADYDVIITNR